METFIDAHATNMKENYAKLKALREKQLPISMEHLLRKAARSENL